MKIRAGEAEFDVPTVAAHRFKRCWLWHSWGGWRDGRSGKVVLNDVHIGFWSEQERRCQQCNASDVRITKSILPK